MLSQHLAYRDNVPPLPEDASRPLWSVMIPTYNCAAYLRETLASVLAQAPSPDVMQIEVVDDCSTQDDHAAIVAELGQGRVKFYQQPKNVGHVKNFQTCIERSQGQLVHILHGDDCVREGFYRKLQSAFEASPEIGAAFCRNIFMDEHSHWYHLSQLEQSKSGVLENWLPLIAAKQRIQTPSIVVHRKVYEELGGFDHRIQYWGEDWEMWVRIAAYYPIWYEVEPLALYRVHSTSLTGNSIRTGKNIQNMRQAAYIIKDYLPQETANQLLNTALEHYADCALDFARKFIAKGDNSAAGNQIREALQCCFSPKTIITSLRLIAKMPFRA